MPKKNVPSSSEALGWSYCPFSACFFENTDGLAFFDAIFLIPPGTKCYVHDMRVERHINDTSCIHRLA